MSTSAAWGPILVALFIATGGAVAVDHDSSGPESAGWCVLRVAHPAAVSWNAPIVLDAMARPVISFNDAAMHALRVATLTPSGWTFETITSGSYLYGSAIEADSVGRLQIAFSDDAQVAWTIRDDAGWRTPETVDDGWLGSVSLATDGSGRPHLAYQPDESRLRYAVREDGGWRVEPVDFAAGGVYSPSIAVDGGGDPHIGYWKQVERPVGAPERGLMHAWRGPDGWHRERVPIGVDPWGVDIEVTTSGTPVLAFTDAWDWFSTDSKVWVARPSGTGWTAQVVDRAKKIGGLFDVALDAADRPHVTHFSTGPGILWYAAPSDSGWMVEPVSAGYATGVAIDAHGRPHLSFVTFYTSELMYATVPPCPQISNASVAVDVDPDTLNLRSRGRWVTAYVRATNATVADIDPPSLGLNGVPVARWSVEGDTLVAKFDRAALAATLDPGRNEVLLTGRWRDGGEFTSRDTMRVIRAGR